MTEPPQRARARLGLMLFLVSLGVLFVASMVAYIALRLSRPEGVATPPIELPAGLWVSTLVLLASGLAIHRAQRQALPQVRPWLLLSFAGGVAFVAVQFPSMLYLLEAHRSLLSARLYASYGLAFGLIVIHALHVLGGMAPLGWLAWKAANNRLLPSHRPVLRACATYWHFLEGVWLVLFGLFLLTL